jgi:hypothetical protein
MIQYNAIIDYNHPATSSLTIKQNAAVRDLTGLTLSVRVRSVEDTDAAVVVITPTAAVPASGVLTIPWAGSKASLPQYGAYTLSAYNGTTYEELVTGTFTMVNKP